LFVVSARSYGLMMSAELSSSAGRSSPTQPIIVPCPSPEEPKTPHSWMSSMLAGILFSFGICG